MHSYELVVSRRRRTIGLIVRDGKVTVRAPAGTSRATIDAFVTRKSRWVAAKLAAQQRAQALASARQPQAFVDGTRLQLLGGELVLRVMPAVVPMRRHCEVSLQLRAAGAAELIAEVAPHVADGTPMSMEAVVARAVTTWFRRTAQMHFALRSRYWAECLGVRARLRRVHVRHYKARWGCCRPDGELRYHWGLITAPFAVVDYVVVHEVAHLIHPNHGKRYWRLVAGAYPDYARCRRWLRDYGVSLGWSR